MKKRRKIKEPINPLQLSKSSDFHLLTHHNVRPILPVKKLRPREDATKDHHLVAGEWAAAATLAEPEECLCVHFLVV